jgi:hypothetical protein
MFEEMQDNYPNNVFAIDLQTIADIVIEYSSYDDLHPNKRGYELLGDLLNEYALKPAAPKDVQIITSNTLNWTVNEPSAKYNIVQETTSFQVQYTKNDGELE